MNTHQKWYYRLLVRNHLAFNASTNVGQELPKNYREKMFKFIKLNEIYRGQNYFELSQIANMDETPIFLNIQKLWKLLKSVQKVNIATRIQNNVREIAIVWIVADNIKLLTMSILKGKPDGWMDCKRTWKHPEVESKQVFAYWHNRVWKMQVSWKGHLMLKLIEQDIKIW